MRAFLAIVLKDLKVRFSSPAELVFFIVLPLVFTVFLSGSLGKMAEKEAPMPLVLVHDAVGSAESRAFVRTLASMPGAQAKEVSDPVELLTDARADLLLTLTPTAEPADGRAFAVSVRLSPWSGSARATAERVGGWLLPVGIAVSGDPAAAQVPEPRVAPAAAAPSAAVIANAGQLITWTLVPLLGLGAGLLTERRRGTARRVLATPAPRIVVTAASVFAEMLGALAQIGLLLSYGVTAFGLRWFSHPVELVALSVGYCFAGASLGTLLGSVCSTSRQAGSLALGVSMVLAVLGGCWYPAALFPSAITGVTRLDPAGWAMDGFVAVLAPSAGAAPALRSAALLLAFGVVAFLLASAASRTRSARAA